MTTLAPPSQPILRLSLRALLGKRRALALLPLNILPIAVAVFSAFHTGRNPELRYAHLVGQLLLPFVVALVSLALASASIADEREDSTLVYLTQTPVPRMAIMGAKILATWVATLAVVFPGVAAAMVVDQNAGGGGVLWLLVAVVLTALAYSAAFSWLSLRMSRAVLTGIAYIVFWEGSIASFAPSADRLSISAYGRVIAKEARSGVSWTNAPAVGWLTAVIVLIAASAIALWFASRRLERMELP